MFFYYMAISIFVSFIHYFNCFCFCPRALYPDVKILEKLKLRSQMWVTDHDHIVILPAFGLKQYQKRHKLWRRTNKNRNFIYTQYIYVWVNIIIPVLPSLWLCMTLSPKFTIFVWIVDFLQLLCSFLTVVWCPFYLVEILTKGHKLKFLQKSGR